MSVIRNLSKTFTILAFSLTIFSCARYEWAGDVPEKPWPFYQGGILHHGFVETGMKPSLRRKWIAQLEEGGNPYAPQEYSSPAADNNLVYFGSIRGKGVKAFDYLRGKLLWHFDVKKGVESSPALYEGKLYFGGNDGYLYAVNASSGELVWKFDAGAEVLSSPIAEGGILYFASSNDVLHALDAVTGKLLWRYKKGISGLFSIRGASSPAYSDGIVYIGFTDGTVAAIGAFDGSLIWEKELKRWRGVKFHDVDSSPVIDGEVIYIASYDRGLFALDAKTGDTIWKSGHGGSSTPALDGKRIYISDREGMVLSLDKDSGEVIWEFRLEEGVPTSAVVIGDYLVFGSSHKRLYLLDKKNGDVVDTYKTSKGFSASPIFYKGYIYALSNAGYAYAFGRFLSAK